MHYGLRREVAAKTAWLVIWNWGWISFEILSLLTIIIVIIIIITYTTLFQSAYSE